MLYRLVVFFTFFSCFSASSQTVIPGYADGKIYVKFRTGTFTSLHREDPRNIPLELLTPFRELISKYGITRVNKPFYQATDDEKLMQVYKFHFKDAAKVNLLIDDLYKIREIEYAEKIPISVLTATPNDFAILSSSVHLNQINAPAAWNVFNGNSNITVAIVDNAVMWSHADLVQNTFTNTAETPGNGIDDDGNGYIDDVNGWNVGDDDNNAEPTNFSMVHGTHVAGIAGARTDNGIGVSSIGWNIKIIPVQCQPDGGFPSGLDYGYEGIVYAARTKAKVINCSWGGTASAVTEQTIVDYAWNKGCIIIAAAGNQGNTAPYYPASYNHVYAVAAVDQSDVKWNFSSYYSGVDISAPGFSIMSTYPYTGSPAYGTSDGTSMAAPMVSGLAALMLSRSPNMTQQDVLNCISSTAANIYTLTGNSGYAGMLGAGRIDAGAAMVCAATYSVKAPVAGFFASEVNTCPNTPVQFNDSSQYVPTAWSWTFQGGSPSTSTLANPVVQYATAGTYSVALTVSNSVGSSTKTKLVYITVAGAIQLPLAEGFQQSQFLPPNWTAKNINNDAAYWERVTGVGGYGTSSACAVFDNFSWRTYLEREEMRTPKYDFSKVSVARLRFDVAYARFNSYYSDTLEVKMSNNCASTWSNIYIKGGSTLATVSDQSVQFIPASTEWRTDSILLANVAGQSNVMFSFINRGHWGQPIYLDNINLFFPSPTVTATYPASICAGQTITYTSTTLGSTNFTWNVGGSVSSGSTATRTYTVPGVFVGTLSAQNGTTIASKTLTITVISIPTLSVNHPTICSGTSATIQANGANAYAWAGGGTTSSLQVSPQVTTVYTVTGVNGGICSSSLTSTVSVIVTPTVAVANQTVCPGGTATLSATGASTYSWNTGSTSSSIIITPSANAVYTVTGSNSFCTHTRTVSLDLSAPLSISVVKTHPSTCSGKTATLQASGAIRYAWNNGGTAPTITVAPVSTTIYTVIGTANTCTGVTTVTVVIDATPQFNYSISPSAPLCSGTTLTLTAFGNASGYAWSTGSSANTTTVTAAANSIYTLTAFNSGCAVSTTISPNIVGTGLNITISANPSNVCAGQSATLTAQGAPGYTWQGGTTGSTIVVSPVATSTYVVEGVNGGCGGQAAITVTVKPLPVSSVSGNSTTCQNECNATINATSTSGSAPYSYTLTNGNMTACNSLPCSGLCAGVYTLTTADSKGCSSTINYSVAVSMPMLATTAVQNVSCTGCTNGAAVVAVSGAGPFTYSWTPAVSTGSVASNLAAGCYTVMVTDVAGCSNSYSVCVLTEVTSGISQQDTESPVILFPNPAHTTFNAESNSEFTLTLINQLGQIIYTGNSIQNKLLINVGNFSQGVYYVQVESDRGIVTKKIILE